MRGTVTRDEIIEVLTQAYALSQDFEDPADTPCMTMWTDTDGSPTMRPLTFREIAATLTDSGALLRVRYAGQTGQVGTGGTADILRLLGRDDLDPARCIATWYGTREAYDAYADANKRHHGHDTIGPATGPGGLLYGVIAMKRPSPPDPG